MPYPAINSYGRYDLDDLETLLIWSGDAPVYVPDVVRKCAIFLGNKDDKGRFHPRATEFVVTFEQDRIRYTYLVTAEHSIAGFQLKGWDIWLRSNLKDGGIQVDKIDAPKWWFHPKNEENPTDVAVLPIVFRQTEDWSFVPLNGTSSISGTADVLMDRHLGLGDEVFITGLFRSHAGHHRNTPILRIGNIAMMKEPVKTRWCGLTESYLIEARSIGGLSGSPVFVHVPPFQAIDGVITPATGPEYYLLGLMHGHFDVPNLAEDIVVEDDDEGNGINTGIGIVIPVEKILETIRDDPELAEMRRKEANHFRKERGATPDFSDEHDPSESDENPNHLEDFNRLVDMAAKKRPQGDQT